jgi:hypothetical protein
MKLRVLQNQDWKALANLQRPHLVSQQSMRRGGGVKGVGKTRQQGALELGKPDKGRPHSGPRVPFFRSFFIPHFFIGYWGHLRKVNRFYVPIPPDWHQLSPEADLGLRKECQVWGRECTSPTPGISPTDT